MAKSWIIFGLALSASFLVKAEEAPEDDDFVVDDEEDVDVTIGDDDDIVEEDIDFEEDIWDGVTLAPSDDIHCQVLFPDHPDKRLPIGKEITMLIGVSNIGSGQFNISHVGAHLHSPYDFNYYIQNFTAVARPEFLFPAAQYTLEYKFTMQEKLEPLDYWFSAFVIINGTDRIYKQTPINGTVTLIRDGSFFGINDVMMYITSLAAIGGIGYAVLLNFAPKGKAKKSYETGTKNQEEIDSSWDLPEVKRSSKKQRKRNKN